MVATVRCAPPANKPTPVERDTCAPWLDRELALLRRRCGSSSRSAPSAGTRALKALARRGATPYRPAAAVRPRRRGAAGTRSTLVGCYHPCQHNTYTGRLTREMLDAVFARARALTE